MRSFRVIITVPLQIDFESDKGTEDSAAHVATEKWTYRHRDTPILSKVLGNIKAIQTGNATVLSCKEIIDEKPLGKTLEKHTERREDSFYTPSLWT